MNKDVRLAHLNERSLRNKIEEVRCVQLLCKFEILAITETHLNKNIHDTEIDIPGIKFVRLDRKGQKGGCLFYYAEHLQATHQRDLFTRNIEAEWLQVKFPSSSVLFSVIYRPPDASGEFFEQIGATLEKAWLKMSNIVLLGDFNCDFQGDSEVSTNARKLQSIFEMYNMQNVVVENTRETQTTSTLIDLIVTTRRDLISKCGVIPLGISDHNLVCGTMKLKNNRAPPKYIKTRDYKKLNVENFRQDIESAPFHVATIFDKPNDVLWAWQALFNSV